MAASQAVSRSDAPSFRDVFMGYAKPGILLTIGMFYSALTLITNPLLPLRDLQEFKHKAFSKMWRAFGAAMSQDIGPDTAAVLRSASGVVLDLGPGTGEMLQFFDPSKITRIYGVEPAVGMHEVLKRNAEKNGFGGKYEIITAGAEVDSLIPALAKNGLINKDGGSAVFDTVVCCRVLCGVPRLEETAEGLYKCLKPGGRMLVAEHVVNPWPNSGGSVVAAALQRLYMLLGWSFFIGGCCLDRDTAKVLKKVAQADGGWEKFELKELDNFACIPFIAGELVKRKDATH